jgi:hypothetical protein
MNAITRSIVIVIAMAALLLIKRHRESVSTAARLSTPICLSV